MDNWQHLFGRRNRPAWVVLLVCFSLTLAAWYGLRVQVMKSAEQQFDLHVRDVIYSIEMRLRRHEQILLGGAGLFDASDSVNRVEWRTYIERLNLKQNYPGIQGVGFSRVIQPADLQAHIAAIRAEGFLDYTVRPSGERSLYTSIIYLEPFSGRNLAAFGYDMLSEATRAKAMHMAAESSKTAISGKVKLVQETHGKEQAGFLMYVPVYRKHQVLATPEQRWKALQGFVFSPYRVDDLMAGILGNRTLLLDFVIFDGDGETDEARMFVSADEPAAGTRTAAPKMTTLRAIHAYGHMWTVRLHSRPEFEASFQSPLNTVILALGGSISVLLFILVSFLISRRERAEEIAVEMTRQIRENEKYLIEINKRFQLATGSAGIGVWDYDIASGVLIWDDGMYRLYRVERDEFEGAYAAWSSRLHPEDRDRSEAELQMAIKGIKDFDTVFRIILNGGELRYIKAYALVELEQDEQPARMIGINYDITDRMEAEAALRESAQLVQAIVDNVVDGLITIDEQGSVESFNKSAEGIFGYAAAEVVGNNVSMLMPEPFHSEHDGYLHNYLSTGKKKIIGAGREVVGRRKNGKTFPMDLAVSEMQLEGGKIFIGVVRDITERRSAAEAIASISNLNRAIVDGAEHLIITTNTSGVIQSLNHAAEMHLGYQANELVEKSTPAVFHDAGEVVRRAQELTAAGIPVQPGFDVFVARAKQIYGGDTHEWTYIRKDGSRFPVLLTITALRDKSGEINAFLGIGTDITERKRAEEELRKLSRAIEQSPVSVVITNAEGNIEYVNAKFSEVTGYTSEEVMGRNPRIVQSGVTPIEVYRAMWQTILGGNQWRGKLQNRKKSGELFWEEVHISAIRDSEGKTTNFVAVKEDITERIKVERMKNEFISTVSHELRTPLTSIRGALALIAGGVVGELPAAVKPLVDIAHKNSERLILLVNDILDIEKIEAGKMEFTAKPVKLMPLLHQALDGNRAYAEQYKVGYELEGEPPDVMVNVDANRLMQVFANLLSNAAKFSPAGSRVLVAVEYIDQRIRVMVKDNGPGIPDEFKGRIFQKFAQADSSDTRKKGGTGLGLSITKAIVEQMGGSIGFESQPNVQTVFYVEFPEWVDKPASQDQSLPLPSLVATGSGLAHAKVLHVEDDPDVFHVVHEVVGEIADVAHARNLAEARHMLAQCRYDLVVLDLNLPDGSGRELLSQLKAALPPVPVLVFSAYDVSTEDMKEVNAVLVKSRTDNEQLRATIKRLIGVE